MVEMILDCRWAEGAEGGGGKVLVRRGWEKEVGERVEKGEDETQSS